MAAVQITDKRCRFAVQWFWSHPEVRFEAIGYTTLAEAMETYRDQRRKGAVGVQLVSIGQGPTCAACDHVRTPPCRACFEFWKSLNAEGPDNARPRG